MKQEFYSKRGALDGVARVKPSASTPAQPRRIEGRNFQQPHLFREPVIPKAPPKKPGRFKRLIHKIKPKTHKQKFTYAGTVLAVIVLAIAGRFLLASCKILSCSGGDGALALEGEVDPTKLRGEGDGRVNILLMGVGDTNHQAADLSDTIQIASLDPIAKDVTIFSIPRDLYIKIPGYGSDRINAAHSYGERDNLEGGGPKLLEETISQALGIPIHYFARVDFTGFKDAVEAVGGVEVDVEQNISDYAYPDEAERGYSAFHIEAGRRFLDGATALKYARSRYTTSDFDRSKRQQKLMVSLKNKALSLGTLSNPVKVNSLLSAVGNHFKTDLNINEILKLIKIGNDVTDQKVTHAGLDNSSENYLASSNVRGASVLVPKAGDFSEIRKYVRSLMVDGFIKKEAATVDVLNGTDQAGLAAATADILKSYGYKIATVGDNSEKGLSKPIIIDYSGGTKPYTIRYLEQRFGVKAESRQVAAGLPHPDITVAVGSDYTPTD